MPYLTWRKWKRGQERMLCYRHDQHKSSTLGVTHRSAVELISIVLVLKKIQEYDLNEALYNGPFAEWNGHMVQNTPNWMKTDPVWNLEKKGY